MSFGEKGKDRDLADSRWGTVEVLAKRRGGAVGLPSGEVQAGLWQDGVLVVFVSGEKLLGVVEAALADA